MVKNRKIADWLKESSQSLKDADIPEPEIEAKFILAHLLNISPGKISAMAINNDNVPEYIIEQANEIINRRCSTRKPLAYLLGQWEFYGILLDIDENVLIPRPETEVLVDAILNNLPDDEILGIDVGTGSGAVAIALLKNRKNWKIIGADISYEALKVARKNAELNELSDRFFPIRCNLCEPFERSDFIVANLPYIPTEQFDELQPEVRCEPRKALDGGSDGLEFIRKILVQFDNIETKFLALEFGFGQKKRIIELIERKNYTYEIIEDYAKTPRIILIGKR